VSKLQVYLEKIKEEKYWYNPKYTSSTLLDMNDYNQYHELEDLGDLLDLIGDDSREAQIKVLNSSSFTEAALNAGMVRIAIYNKEVNIQTKDAKYFNKIIDDLDYLLENKSVIWETKTIGTYKFDVNTIIDAKNIRDGIKLS